jgi:amino-acid N-acetyltransferase
MMERKDGKGLKGGDTMKFRKATVQDAKDIHTLINQHARKDDMLPRSLNEIYDHLRDYLLSEADGMVIGVCAMHIVWDDLAEIRSLAVSKKYRGKDIGRKLIRKLLREAKALGIKNVFALTYQPGYFKKLGFEDIDKNDLPHKVWGDCLKCPKFPDCDESAVIKRLDSA